MRYAVISDVHSNLEALGAVLHSIDTIGVDSILCLGDIVGYNADPNECVEIIRERGIVAVMGNHDERVAGIKEPHDFNPIAADAVYWTREELTEENLEYLRGLPRRLLLHDGIMMIHGWVNDTDRYIMNPHDAEVNFHMLAESGSRLCFFGHPHVAVAYIRERGEVGYSFDEQLSLEEEKEYLINPGGAGQPRDRDPRAPFLIYDSDQKTVTFHRVEYDIEKTMEKILYAGLPRTLAERLRSGW